MTQKDLLHVVRNLIREALEFNNNKTFIPPHEVMNAAKSAMSMKGNAVNGGNKGNGENKASDLASGNPQTFDQMKRLLSFFETEQKNKDSVAWKLHGGDVAYAWVKREIGALNDSNMRSKKVARAMGGAGINKGMGTMDRNMMSTTNTRTRSAWSAVKNREQNG